MSVEELDEAGFGHMVARLGRREVRKAFFSHQNVRNDRLTNLVQDPPQKAPPRNGSPIWPTASASSSWSIAVAPRTAGRWTPIAWNAAGFNGHLEREELADGDSLPLLRGFAEQLLRRTSWSTKDSSARAPDRG